jgi:malonate transporter and related proteins
VIAVVLALLPVFIVIMAGFALSRSRLVVESHWAGVDHICYFVLFPALIFKEIAAADFSGVPVWHMAAAMMLALCTMFMLLLLFRRPLCRSMDLDGRQYSSLFQGATRWHTFIAFAIIPLYFGQGALALGAVSAAAMTPLLNVANVAVISRYAAGHLAQSGTLFGTIIRNPFFLSSVAGILYKLTGLPLPAMAILIFDMIGRGALGLALLTAGAGLRFDEALTARAPIAVATILKLAIVPVVMWIWLRLFGVTGEPAAVAILCSAVPTGSGAYILARRMGADAALVANILTVQVICAAVTIPLVLAFLT